MSGVTDDAEPTPTQARPSPQLFARPAVAAGQGSPDSEPAQPAAPSDVTAPSQAAGEVDSRFPSTGDPRVDHALAQLPDPKEHRRDAGRATYPMNAAPAGGSAETSGDHDNAAGEERPDDATSGLDLPDPALLDAHLSEVTSVHRQLQQRLSDLSG